MRGDLSSRAVAGFFGALVVVGVALGLWAVATDRSAMIDPASISSGPSSTAAMVATTAPSPAPKHPATSTAGVPVVPPRPFDRPASFGARLTAVTEPPPDTLVLAASNAASDGATYDTVFAPYGFAAREGDLRDPTTGTGSDALVVQVLASTSREGTAALSLSGRNVLLDLTPKTAGKVVTGGQYNGTVVLVRRGAGLVPVLTVVWVPKKR
jgi:hypothetical protein